MCFFNKKVLKSARPSGFAKREGLADFITFYFFFYFSYFYYFIFGLEVSISPQLRRVEFWSLLATTNPVVARLQNSLE